MIWSLLLFLSSSFLLILGQELLETRPSFLLVVSGIFSKTPRGSGQTGLQTGLYRPDALLLILPPSVESSEEASRDFFFCSDLGLSMTTFFPFVDSA